MSFDERIQRINWLIRGLAVAQSPILRTTITIKRLKMRGYVSLIEYYNK
jgi:hypothetical protein